MVASSVLLDSRFAMWTRFWGALDLFDTFGSVGIVVANLIKLGTGKSFMPYTLVFVATLGRTVTTSDFVAALQVVELTTATVQSRTPHPILSSLLFNL